MRGSLIPDLAILLANQKLEAFSTEGRSLIYSANCELIEELIDFMKEKCCDLGDTDYCPPKLKRRKK